MIALDLKSLLFLILLILGSVIVFSVLLDRRRFRDPLLVRSGAQPDQLVHLFESAPVGLVLLNLQLQTVYANEYARHLLQFNPSTGAERSDRSPGVALGRSKPLALHSAKGRGLAPRSTRQQALAPGESLSAPWWPELEHDLATVQAQGQAQPYYRALSLPAGQTISWWICPLPHFHLLFVLDLTHQRRLQKASQTFLSTLSHELRTPLTAVLAHLDIVRKRAVDEQTQAHSLAIIHQEMNRLARLVQDMLRLGNLEMSEEMEKRPLDLLLVAEAAVAEVILLAEEKNIALSLETTGPLPPVPGDADRLKQVFLNVLDNSMKYGRPGDQIAVCLIPEAGGVRVTIQDTGPGIPPEHLPRVVEPLYRVHTNGQESGLGLAIVAEILRLHHAKLEIESPGAGKESGVSVSFLLPAPS